MKLQMRHELPCSPAAFWAVFLDAEATERMYREALGATTFEVKEQVGDVASGMKRVLYNEQPVDAPGPIKKLVGSNTGSTETGEWDPADQVWSFTMRPSTLGDKIRISGTMRTEATDDGCERIFEMEASVKILGIGKVFEGFIERQTREAQDATAAWFRSQPS